MVRTPQSGFRTKIAFIADERGSRENRKLCININIDWHYILFFFTNEVLKLPLWIVLLKCVEISI